MNIEYQYKIFNNMNIDNCQFYLSLYYYIYVTFISWQYLCSIY